MYDAGALIAADRDDRRFWAEHRQRLNNGLRPFTTAPVVAQVSRSPKQALLHRLLADCEVLPFEVDDMHRVGRLLALADAPDVVDAHVIVNARRRGAMVVTSDVDDITTLASHVPNGLPVRRP